MAGPTKEDFVSYAKWLEAAVKNSINEDLTTKKTIKVKEGKKWVEKEIRVWPTTWTKFHGGGTSKVPNCRPYYKQSSGDPTEYQAKLDIMDGSASKDTVKYSAVVDVVVPTRAGKTYPLSHDILNALRAACIEKSK